MIRTRIDKRRYLARFDTRALGHLYSDCLIIGGGVGGMRAALAAAETAGVIILSKGHVSDSNTYYAQGGIAAAVGEDDSIAAHRADTVKTGCGLCDEEVVDLVVSGAPDAVKQLQSWSMPLDMEDGRIATGREGGHGHARIIHALGDATGKAMALCLLEQVKQHDNIKIFEECFAIDLLTEAGRCLGVLCYHRQHGLQCIWARRTILASGGAGQLYRETSNPAGATADGLAMAYRAGAVLEDLEFMQFHPTTLYIAGAERKLITEALRGEGGYLVDRRGERFMSRYHEMAELAPRDVVSRAIYTEMSRGQTTNVFLDVRHLGGKWLAQRFPTISELCKSFDIDVATDLIPVRPSAHYHIGGVKSDINGRSSIKHLYCCGEVAATGLHGANRLASNSLLEGLIFGEICGRAVAQEVADNHGQVDRHTIDYEVAKSLRTRLDLPDVTNSLRAVMWRNVGLERVGDRLTETIEIIDFWRRYVMDKVFDDPVGWQCQNMLTVSWLMAESARQREESRGVHFRRDFPQRDDEHFTRHIQVLLPH